jgi:hypothetical protein
MHNCTCVYLHEGFTTMSKLVAPSAVMMFLNDLFARFDELLDVYGIHKV